MAYPESVYLKSLEVHVAILPGILSLLCEHVCRTTHNVFDEEESYGSTDHNAT